MIRSNLPLPFLYRLRLQAGAAARRALSASPVDYRRSRSQPGGARPAGARSLAIRRAATSDTAQAWLNFIDQYEAFTDVLCAAAKTGCDGQKENEYAQMRRWFVANYYRTAARVRPYLEAEGGEGGEPPSITDYAGQRRALDVLEALFLPATLRDVLRQDTGDLIPRVARISEAVYRCHADWEDAQAV